MKKKLGKKIKKVSNNINKKLLASEVKYRRLFESAHDGILMLDSETGQITDVNPFLIKLLEYSKEEFLNKKLWEVGAFRNVRASKDVFKILQNEGYVRYEDLPLETKAGKLVSVEFVSNSYLAGGELVIQCNIRDITERKEVDQIKESKRLLEVERWKVESIADATHELRTPLAIIKGNVDLAMRHISKKPKPMRTALKDINYEIGRLAKILTDLSLITSKAWELKNRIVYKKLDLRVLVKKVVGQCKPLAYKKNISITSSEMPRIIMLGDEGYLAKMIINLVKNSIIYGRKNGHTKISVKKSKNLITISVADDGIGISEEDLPHVFERFYRADKFQRSHENNVGLGLAIVKWVAEIHGGSVKVQSVQKKGSVFSVSIPTNTIM
ncbi:MAG: PAS domain S-box protein [Patescibacteria group bacterium]|nr:PAS domain S-box protein [Patescibacteria group bacterium]